MSRNAIGSLLLMFGTMSGCAGGSGPPASVDAPTAPIASTPVRGEGGPVDQAVADPCSGQPGCYASSVGKVSVVVRQIATGYDATVTMETGEHLEVLWQQTAVDADSPGLTFVVENAEGQTLGPVDLGPTTTNPPGVAAASLYIALQTAGVMSAADMAPSFPGSNLYAPAARRLAYTGPNPDPPWSNTAGCDSAAAPHSCQLQGGCCDVHDACITANCGNGRGSGDFREYLRSWVTTVAMDVGCMACHIAVLHCFLDDTHWPGPSNCCLQHNCGKPQQCMVNDLVITSPCACAQQDPPLKSLDVCALVTCGRGDTPVAVGSTVFTFQGTSNASISGGGGFGAEYTLLVGADLQSSLVGYELYTVRSVDLQIDISYSSTPQCRDRKTDQVVSCASLGVSQLSECLTVLFYTEDFDLSSALLRHVAAGSAANPLPEDVFQIDLRLAGAKQLTWASGTSISFDAGSELLLGTSSGAGYPEVGYFYSDFVLPAPYEQFGLSPGGGISGRASVAANR
jgi:hypothetical protein